MPKSILLGNLGLGQPIIDTQKYPIDGTYMDALDPSVNEEPYQTCFKCQFPQLKQSVFAKGDTYFGSFIAYLLPILVSCRFLSLWFALGQRAVFGAVVCSVFTISCELFVFEEEGSLKQNSCNFRIVLFCKASSSILLTFFDLREN